MCNGLETRNGVGGEGHARYGYPWLPRLAAPNFWCLIEDHWGYVLPHF
jgi:hypothetical protein